MAVEELVAGVMELLGQLKLVAAEGVVLLPELVGQLVRAMLAAMALLIPTMAVVEVVPVLVGTMLITMVVALVGLVQVVLLPVLAPLEPVGVEAVPGMALRALVAAEGEVTPELLGLLILVAVAVAV